MTDHDSYRQFYEVIAKRQLSNNEAFDKAILSLSSAGLGLTLTFFKFVVPAAQATSLNHIKWAWALFVAAIICTLVSYYTSNRALAIELKHAEKYYLEDDESFEAKNNPASNVTEILNVVAGLLFIGAIVRTVLFVMSNL